MKHLKTMALTGSLAIALALSPSISTAGNHERGYKKSKIAQKHLSRSHFNKHTRHRKSHGHHDHSYEEHNHRGHHNRHNRHHRHNHHEHYDDYHDTHHDHHYDHHDRHHHEHGHHNRHRDHVGHWLYSMNHKIRDGFGFQFGIHK